MQRFPCVCNARFNFQFGHATLHPSWNDFSGIPLFFIVATLLPSPPIFQEFPSDNKCKEFPIAMEMAALAVKVVVATLQPVWAFFGMSMGIVWAISVHLGAYIVAYDRSSWLGLVCHSVSCSILWLWGLTSHETQHPLQGPIGCIHLQVHEPRKGLYSYAL